MIVRMDMDVGALLQTAHHLIRTGRFDEAIAQYDNVIEMDKNNTIALEHNGQVYYYLGRYENAISCYDQVFAINQNLIAVWFNKGYTLRKSGQFLGAITCLIVPIPLIPNIPLLLQTRATIKRHREVQGGDCML